MLSSYTTQFQREAAAKVLCLVAQSIARRVVGTRSGRATLDESGAHIGDTLHQFFAVLPSYASKMHAFTMNSIAVAIRGLARWIGAPSTSHEAMMNAISFLLIALRSPASSSAASIALSSVCAACESQLAKPDLIMQLIDALEECTSVGMVSARKTSAIISSMCLFDCVCAF